MIKKLRIKFIAIIMSIVAIILILILGLVFHFTRQNLEQESITMIQNIAAEPFLERRPSDIPNDIRLPYFTLEIDANQKIIATSGNYYDLTNSEFLNELVSETYSSTKNYGIIDEYKLRYFRFTTPLSAIIVFTDISSELATRDSLLQTCIFIGITSFIAIFIVSIWLSKWAIDPIEKAWKQQKRFISDASHELKTPLTVIITSAELLQSGEYKPESENVLLENIHSTSHKMKTLLEQMLTLAKSDTIEEKPAFKNVDLSKIAQRTALTFEPIFFEKDIELNIQINENISILADENSMCELLDILLDNAFKYSFENTKTIISLNKTGEKHCLLSVQNSGYELTQYDIENIFNRFYCADTSRTQSASFGLGLSIAKNIIKQHSGKIYVQSNNGTNIFYVELPANLN